MTVCGCENQEIKNFSTNGIYVSHSTIASLRNTLIFYENGYLFDGDYTDDITKLQNVLNNNRELLSHDKRFKRSWGCFKVDGQNITTQTFYELRGGMFGIIKQEGVIINDTTFVIARVTNNQKTLMVSDTFSLKPL